MLVAFAVLALLISVVLAGGRLRHLADVPLRRPGLVFAALAVQVLIVSVIPDKLSGMHAPVHLATYGLVAAFAWSNRRLPGVPTMALGAACNFVAIGANGGVMPASRAALTFAGMPADKGDAYANSAVVSGGANLPWLGDVFAVPASWPASNVFSIGDMLIVIGFAVCVHLMCHSRLSLLGRRAAAA